MTFDRFASVIGQEELRMIRWDGENKAEKKGEGKGEDKIKEEDHKMKEEDAPV